MRTVVVSFDTQVQSFPGVFTPGKFRVSIAAGIADQDVDGPSATFTDVPAGDYVARVVRLNADGTELGAAATAAFTVPADMTLVAIPLTVSVAIADGVPA